jgi:hypothetical protein
MGFPASGVESAYRNDIGHVAEMLNGKSLQLLPHVNACLLMPVFHFHYDSDAARHFMHYMIWNLSQRPYDYGLFHDMIQPLGWPDHHAPALSLLFKIVSGMDSYVKLASGLKQRSQQHSLTVMLQHCRWLKADKKNIAVVHCMVCLRTAAHAHAPPHTQALIGVIFCGTHSSRRLARDEQAR